MKYTTHSWKTLITNRNFIDKQKADDQQNLILNKHRVGLLLENLSEKRGQTLWTGSAGNLCVSADWRM